MLKYLVILLDDTSVSFCHYSNIKCNPHLISIHNLQNAIFYAQKNNLSIQVVLPNYELPEEYESILNTVDYIRISPFPVLGDIIVVNQIDQLELITNANVILRISMQVFLQTWESIVINSNIKHLNIIFSDFTTITETELFEYKKILLKLADLYVEKRCTMQLNILTDRCYLSRMNNCNAGVEHITVAPDGKFYICPAFYQEDLFFIGDIENGVDIKNSQLYEIDYAPICKICDAYHCKRCVWLNHKTTLEVNTPSHEYCVMSHVERNASCYMINKININDMHELACINEIDYLDPFDILIKKRNE